MKTHVFMLSLGVLVFMAGVSGMAQTPPAVPPMVERRVQTVPVQLSKDRVGVALVDSDAGTIWVYEFVPAAGDVPASMRLYAARSWLFDRALQNYNQIGVSPDEVRQMVEQQLGGGAAAAKAGALPPAASQPAEPVLTVQVVPVQIDRDRHGLAMVDQQKGTVWVYEFVTHEPKTPNAMRLYAARTWLFDRLLENYRQTSPTPEEVLRKVQPQKGLGAAATSQPTPAKGR